MLYVGENEKPNSWWESDDKGGYRYRMRTMRLRDASERGGEAPFYWSVCLIHGMVKILTCSLSRQANSGDSIASLFWCTSLESLDWRWRWQWWFRDPRHHHRPQRRCWYEIADIVYQTSPIGTPSNRSASDCVKYFVRIFFKLSFGFFIFRIDAFWCIWCILMYLMHSDVFDAFWCVWCILMYLMHSHAPGSMLHKSWDVQMGHVTQVSGRGNGTCERVLIIFFMLEGIST